MAQRRIRLLGRTAGGLLVACALAATIGLVAAGAAPSDPWTLSPASGPVGTTITFSGIGCTPNGSAYVKSDMGGDFYPFPVAADGSWSGQALVRQGTPAGTYHFTAGCAGPEGAPGSPGSSDFTEVHTFEVTAAAATTTVLGETTTVPPDTTPATTTPTTQPSAVSGTGNFTG